MSLSLFFDKKHKLPYVIDQSTKDILKGSFFGELKGDRLELSPEEALYLMDARKATCEAADSGKELTFNEVAAEFSTSKKFMARYFTYKDWRDRGLVIRKPEEMAQDSGKSNVQIKRYKSESLK